MIQLCASPKRNTCALCVHVALFAADEVFARFHFIGELSRNSFIHSFADAMEYEPCGFLVYAQAFPYFVRGNILAVGNHLDRTQPLIQTDSGIFRSGYKSV